MADKQIKKLNNIFFYGVSLAVDDRTDVSLDIITNIRMRFLVTKKPASNKLYRTANGANYVYSYSFNLSKPLHWRVTRNKRVVEEIEQLLAGKYCINQYDDQGKDLKKVFFDSKHRWFKTNYYNSMANDSLVCSLVPKEFDEGTSILKYVTGEVYPVRLLPCTVPSCDTVRQRLLQRIPTPQVTALTDRGVLYFVTEEDKDNYEYILSEEEEKYTAENAPEVYVTKEDTESGFNLSVKDFDMTKNLNRTFDISLAQEFGSNTSADAPATVSERTAEPVVEIVNDAEISELTVKAYTVDEAISDVVQQINLRTSLDIDASDILSFDVVSSKNETDDFDTADEYITIKNTDSSIDKQLEHIDSVLDGTSLLNSDKKLVIGDSVVDDDYISSIIDGIISSAFNVDSKDSMSVADTADTAAEGGAVDTTQDFFVNIPDNIVEEATEAEPEVKAELNTSATEDEPELPDTEDVQTDISEPLTIVASSHEYLEFNPADSVIESRGETYSYYGTLDENGKRSGRGRTLMSDGSIAYEGEYLDDKRFGQGSFYYKDGSLCYWGNWENNLRTGFGVGISSEDRAIHAGNWSSNKPVGLGARFDAEGNLMFLSSNCEDKKKGFTISDISDKSFIVRVWDEKSGAFVQKEITIDDIL